MGSTMDSKEFDLYKDIRCRTNGEIYIGDSSQPFYTKLPEAE